MGKQAKYKGMGGAKPRIQSSDVTAGTKPARGKGANPAASTSKGTQSSRQSRGTSPKEGTK